MFAPNSNLVAVTLLVCLVVKCLYAWVGCPPHTTSTFAFVLLSFLGQKRILVRALCVGYLMLLLVIISRPDILVPNNIFRRISEAALLVPREDTQFILRYALMYVPLLFLFSNLDEDDYLLSLAAAPNQRLRHSLFVVSIPVLFVLSARDVVAGRILAAINAIERRGIELRNPVSLVKHIRLWASLVVIQVLVIATDFLQIHEAYRLKLIYISLERRRFRANKLLVCVLLFWLIGFVYVA